MMEKPPEATETRWCDRCVRVVAVLGESYDAAQNHEPFIPGRHHMGFCSSCGDFLGHYAISRNPCT